MRLARTREDRTLGERGVIGTPGFPAWRSVHRRKEQVEALPRKPGSL